MKKHNIIYTVFKDTDREFTGTRKEIADHFGISFKYLSSRLSDTNYSIEEIIDMYRKHTIYTIFKGTDKEFTGTISEIATHFNINKGTFRSRVESNKNAKLEALIDYDRSPEIYTVFKGTDREFTGNCNQIAKHFGINDATLRARVLYSKNPISMEDAINKIIYHTVFKGTDREFTGTIYQISKHFGFKGTTIKSRMDKGLTLEEAIDYKYNSMTVFKGTDREFTGNCTEISEHFGIKNSTLKMRMLNNPGLSLEEAIDFIPKRNH